MFFFFKKGISESVRKVLIFPTNIRQGHGLGYKLVLAPGKLLLPHGDIEDVFSLFSLRFLHTFINEIVGFGMLAFVKAHAYANANV